MNPTEPVKRLKFGFIFYAKKYGFKSQANSKRDLNPRYYFLYDLRRSVYNVNVINKRGIAFTL